MARDTFSDILFKRYKDPFKGFRLSKHFFDRYVERFDQPEVIRDIIRHVDKNLCMIVFDCSLREDEKIMFRTADYAVPLKLESDRGVPMVVATTIFWRTHDRFQTV